MRVSKEQAAENRERILKAASRLMRERGISSVGVDALTEAAGMTHGSLYSQFGSKERLVEEAVAHAIATKGQEVPKAFVLSDYVSEYLSTAHRDMPGSGCPFAALCCEMPRQSKGVRARFTAGVRGMIGLLSGRMGSGLKQRQRDDTADITANFAFHAWMRDSLLANTPYDQMVRQILEIFRAYNFTTQVLVASVRNPVHVLTAARMGAHVATLPFAVINQLANHPLTDSGIAKFLADWEKVPKK